MTDKEAQLKAKLLKMKLAEQKKWSATGLSPEEVQKVRAIEPLVMSKLLPLIKNGTKLSITP